MLADAVQAPLVAVKLNSEVSLNEEVSVFAPVGEFTVEVGVKEVQE